MVGCVLLSLFLFLGPTVDSFTNYAQMMDPTVFTVSHPDKEAANQQYASLLLYLKKNPADSAAFIDDIKRKFFKDQCTVKNLIDFEHIAEMPQGMVF